VTKGEVVGLIGDNGAGKSTLIKTLVGVYAPDEGDIFIKGKKVKGWTAAKARNSGIETVFQDRALCPQQSIVWNIFMGKELRYPFGFIREKEQISEANRLIREIGFTSKLIDAESPVGNLSGGERQGVAIARAIYNNAELIILDEPTNALSLNETQKVFEFVNNVKKSNRSVLFIGHNIYHVYDISDRFVILDRGEVVHQLNKQDIGTPEELMKIMRDTVKKH
jgi:simple sugar transport system ATP-binding protein